MKDYLNKLTIETAGIDNEELDEFSETLTNGIRVNQPYILERNANHTVMQTAKVTECRDEDSIREIIEGKGIELNLIDI